MRYKNKKQIWGLPLELFSFIALTKSISARLKFFIKSTSTSWLRTSKSKAKLLISGLSRPD